MIDDIKSNFATDDSPVCDRNRVLLFVFVAIIISILLAFYSMYLYNNSGAAQLDLSRPGYKEARSKATDSISDFQNFPQTGSVSQSTIDEFKELYEKQASKIKSFDAFGTDPLNPDVLGVNSENGIIPE